MKTHADFDVIDVVEDGSSYPALLGIGWDNDSMVVINFKKRVMMFENQNVRVITPMDPQEGRLYIEPMNDEVGRSWITLITSLKIISNLPSMANLDGAVQVLRPLTSIMLWKIGRIGCMKYHSGNAD